MNYRTQLERLRERFLRADTEAKFQSACVKGGLIVKQYFNDGGIIGNQELTRFYSDYLNAADENRDELLAEFTLWSGFQLLAKWASDDPNILELKVFSRADGITLLNSKPGSHEEQSERFAAFCDEIIDTLKLQKELNADTGEIVPTLVTRFHAIWKQRKNHDHQWVANIMADKTTTDEWDRYRVAKNIKNTQTIVAYFKKLSASWNTDPSRIPSNLK